jgi:alkylhydroperoxidase/carboxymuconolactone decarboxylase family protein YurZ
MSEHYHDENDLRLMREMRKLAPQDFNAWIGLNSIVGRENGAIPRKYRELIAIAVSATTQCPYLPGGSCQGGARCGCESRRGRGSVVDRRGASRGRRSDPWGDGAQIF